MTQSYYVRLNNKVFARQRDVDNAAEATDLVCCLKSSRVETVRSSGWEGSEKGDIDASHLSIILSESVYALMQAPFPYV